MAIIEEVIETPGAQETVDGLKKQGNELFGSGKFEEAIDKYKKALDLCPETDTAVATILLSNQAACYIKMEKWNEAVEVATKALENDSKNEKALERRAFACSHLSEKYEQAIEDYQELQKQCPTRKNISSHIEELKKKIDDRNEKLKADVMEKLKGFGNMCLKPFGLSTDSFEMVPNGQGGYSVQMKNNAPGN